MKKTFVHQIRKQLSLTQQEVADKLGVLRQTYATKEQRENFTDLEWNKLSEIFKINIDEERKKFNEMAVIKEPDPTYYSGGFYRTLIKDLNKAEGLQRAQFLVLAEILAKVSDKPVSAATREIKTIIKASTGLDYDL